jgi:sulfatase maturation enzyme AslB (radical SAM superfamily)
MQFYNSDEMRTLRTQFLNGEKPKECAECYYQDAHDKLSGRIKQLNKSGIIQDHFDLSLFSSPHYKHFKYTQEHQGKSDYYPVDLQIDLGNTCNSACIMCHPSASSRLQQDYKKLHKINTMFENPRDFMPWVRDSNRVEQIAAELEQIPNIRYIHFLGGETLYDETFYTLCERLIEQGLSKNIIVGTTTNGTIYDHRIERLISEFKEFHLGISIESVTELNDYIRYPSKIGQVKDNIKKFLTLREQTNLHLALRITPNIFTVYELDQVFDFMIEHSITAESCNILSRPEQLKMELLPDDIRNEVIEKLSRFTVKQTNDVNIRRPDLTGTVIGNVIAEYQTFLQDYAVPENADESRFKLVEFLKAFETLRNNSIIDYAPRYTEFLRHYGY